MDGEEAAGPLDASEFQRYMIDRLLTAGASPEAVEDLAYRHRFLAIAQEGTGSRADLLKLVDDQSPEVQAAWAEIVDRYLDLFPPTSG